MPRTHRWGSAFREKTETRQIRKGFAENSADFFKSLPPGTFRLASNVYSTNDLRQFARHESLAFIPGGRAESSRRRANPDQFFGPNGHTRQNRLEAPR